MTGIFDNPLMYTNNDTLKNVLEELKQTAIDTNKKWAKKLGISESVAITCLKPSGTVSQLVNCASGIHPRHSQHYIRTVRADKKDPLAQMMEAAGFPCEDDLMNPTHNYVFSFPIRSPEKCITRDELSAIEHLELWKIYKKHWAEHTVSITVSVKEHEWIDVASWVYKNFNDVVGISFLPYSEHVYKQAPYQDAELEEVENFEQIMPKEIDWSALYEYEHEDNTVASQTMACSGNNCELVDVVASAA